MKKAVIILAIVASLTACNKVKTEATTTTGPTTEIHEHKEGEANDEKVAYVCPMDCENGKTYDQAGKCPKCEMNLEKK